MIIPFSGFAGDFLKKVPNCVIKPRKASDGGAAVRILQNICAVCAAFHNALRFAKQGIQVHGNGIERNFTVSGDKGVGGKCIHKLVKAVNFFCADFFGGNEAEVWFNNQKSVYASELFSVKLKTKHICRFGKRNVVSVAGKFVHRGASHVVTANIGKSH